MQWKKLGIILVCALLTVNLASQDLMGERAYADGDEFYDMSLDGFSGQFETLLEEQLKTTFTRSDLHVETGEMYETLEVDKSNWILLANVTESALITPKGIRHWTYSALDKRESLLLTMLLTVSFEAMSVAPGLASSGDLSIAVSDEDGGITQINRGNYKYMLQVIDEELGISMP